MNSSGIKRGLAVSAVSALAVVGIPALSSTASAAAGDVLKVVSVGPALNGDGPGAQILVQVTHNSVAAPGDLKIIGSDLTSSPNTPTQTVVEGTVTAAPTDSNPNDGLDEYIVPVKVTTPLAGDTAKFAIYNDADKGNDVDASEARTQASVTTSGPLKSMTLSPSSQSTSTGQDSGAYTVTLLDGAGRTTQLSTVTPDTLTVAATNGATPSDTSIDADEIASGSYDFTVKGGSAGTSTVTVTDGDTPAIKASATLTVAPAAALTADNINVVTGADSWSDFGDQDSPATLVRVDQSSLRLDFQGTTANPNKNAVVVLTATKKSGNVTFNGGKAFTSATTTLDADGNGSLTITPDAGTIREGDVITVSGDGFSQDFKFVKAAADSIKTTPVYFAAFGGSVTVDATVLDQFGQPVTTGYVTAARSGANTDTTPQKQAVGPDGKVSFTFTDTKAKDAVTKSDVVTFNYYVDQYATMPAETATTTIKYSADGKGADFNTTLNSMDTEATNYDPSKNSIIPLADAVADSSNEEEVLDVTGAEANQPVTVSVDNGALILNTNKSEDNLSEGVSSINGVTDGSGELAGYEIVGTKSGLVTVTIASANRTETAQFTVAKQTDRSTARNVTVSGPAEVESGATQIAYTAVVTDAFGNPVPNVSVYDLNIQVTGPAHFQDGDVVTNDAGQLNLNVGVDSAAVGDVTIKVTGLPHNWSYTQFGAAADQLDTSAAAKSAPGLPASSNVGTATTTVKAAPVVVPEDINLVLSGKDNGAKADKLKANADNNATGLIAKLFRVVNGHKKLIDSAALNQYGNHKFVEADKNGNKKTTYVVKVAASDTTNADSASKTVR